MVSLVAPGTAAGARKKGLAWLTLTVVPLVTTVELATPPNAVACRVPRETRDTAALCSHSASAVRVRLLARDSLNLTIAFMRLSRGR